MPGFVHSPLLPAAVRGTESKELFHGEKAFLTGGMVFVSITCVDVAVTDWLPTIVRGIAGSTTLDWRERRT